MAIYFIRHAKAGSRRDWDGPDADRPLSKNGWKQAESIAARLGKRHPAVLVSSPFVRCRQTLEPLARATDLDVVSDERLAAGEPFEAVLDLFAELSDGAVLCSHGDVIPETIAALQRRGCVIDSTPEWRKGSVWKLERDGEQFTRATVWFPPE